MKNREKLKMMRIWEDNTVKPGANMLRDLKVSEACIYKTYTHMKCKIYFLKF